RTPESCADAIRAWRDWTAPVEQPEADTKRVASARALLADAGSQLDEQRSGEVFEALGVARAATQVIREPGQPVDVPYAVVAKILSQDILHKTDAGGVVLNIA